MKKKSKISDDDIWKDLFGDDFGDDESERYLDNENDFDPIVNDENIDDNSDYLTNADDLILYIDFFFFSDPAIGCMIDTIQTADQRDIGNKFIEYVNMCDRKVDAFIDDLMKDFYDKLDIQKLRIFSEYLKFKLMNCESIKREKIKKKLWDKFVQCKIG